MTLINFLSASRIQAAIECLPRTCADDHRDRYSAGQGEIEMNATETEMRIANDMVEFLHEYVKQKRCNSMEVTVLFMARMFSHEDKDMHVDGIPFSQKLSEILPGAGS